MYTRLPGVPTAMYPQTIYLLTKRDENQMNVWRMVALEVTVWLELVHSMAVVSIWLVFFSLSVGSLFGAQSYTNDMWYNTVSYPKKKDGMKETIQFLWIDSSSSCARIAAALGNKVLTMCDAIDKYVLVCTLHRSLRYKRTDDFLALKNLFAGFRPALHRFESHTNPSTYLADSWVHCKFACQKRRN